MVVSSMLLMHIVNEELVLHNACQICAATVVAFVDGGHREVENHICFDSCHDQESRCDGLEMQSLNMVDSLQY